MNLRRLIAVSAVVAFLFVGTVMPRQAHAADTEDIVIIIAASIVGYVAVVVIATALLRRQGQLATLAPTPPGTTVNRGEKNRRGVRFGYDCPSSSPNPARVCW